MRRFATNAAIDQVKAAGQRAWVPLDDVVHGEHLAWKYRVSFLNAEVGVA